MTDRELLNMAFEAAENAYAPYSGLRVGAALECADGSVFLGCNVENASFSDTICAERTAVVKAVSEGRRSFRRIAVAADSEEGAAGVFRGYGGPGCEKGRPLCQLPAQCPFAPGHHQRGDGRRPAPLRVSMP